jgi:hypothetical protein
MPSNVKAFAGMAVSNDAPAKSAVAPNAQRNILLDRFAFCSNILGSFVCRLNSLKKWFVPQIMQISRQ